MKNLDELIRRRAYELWEQGDKTHRSASETDFWLQAEREIRQAYDGNTPAAPLDTLEQRLE
jgi:Protein of unknown function (DUF2934)